MRETYHTLTAKPYFRARTHTHAHTSFNAHYHTHPFSYTYQTLTAKPFFMSDSTASVMEPIAAGHAVPEPHDVEFQRQSGPYSVLWFT